MRSAFPKRTALPRARTEATATGAVRLFAEDSCDPPFCRPGASTPNCGAILVRTSVLSCKTPPENYAAAVLDVAAGWLVPDALALAV